MKIKVRKAEITDIESILNIVNHEIANTTVIYDYAQRTLEEQLVWFEDKVKQGFPVIVATKEGKVVGFGTYGFFRTKEAYKKTIEHSIYIAKDVRGFGIGHVLMEKLIQLAVDEGYHVMIGVIDASNIGSVEFHERFGFTVAGKFKEVGYKFDRWLDIFYMQKMLN